MGEFRWSQLASSGDGLFEPARRVVGRGEYRGLTFHEVEARSIISKAPPSTPWFGHSINAYRGCSHACTYCLSGDTEVLMADRTTKAIAHIESGDRIYGTSWDGTTRRLVDSQVLNHWSTTKRAYRIETRSGTSLTTSGDHRFLTEEGWKSVTDAESGHDPRPHLTRKNLLIALPRSPNERDDRFVGLDLKSVEPLDADLPLYDITTTTGDFIANGVVSHNCFARPTHDYLGFNIRSDFETQIVVKVNAVDLLRAELSPSRWRGDSIAMGTNTDPYQAAEGKYRLTRGIVELLVEQKNPFSILTKSPLVLRDLDLITEAARRAEVRVDFSVATVDEDVWRRTEPAAPHPRRRLEAVAKLRAAGIPSGVMMAPIIPGISDSPRQMGALKKAADEAGAEWVHEVPLHLRGVRKHFLDWLQTDSPQLMPMYRELYPERKQVSRRKQLRKTEDGQLSLPIA